jgi:hypothetical protein
MGGLGLMPAGDAQRVWFPEMLEELKTSWSETMSWDELADFCARMTEKRKQIRQARGIQSPRTISLLPGERCAKCGRVSKTSKPDPLAVSIRSALFALKNDGLISEAEFKEIDKSWMKHKKRNGLDAFGQKSVPPPDEGAKGPDTSCHE